MSDKSASFFRKKNIAGLSLVELMVSVAILGVGVMAGVGSFHYISASLQVSKSRTLASNLAQEQVEKLKNLSYYMLLVTTATTSDTRFSPPLNYDTGNYPQQTLYEGGISFTRATRVDFAFQNGSLISTAPWTSNDTGLKLITTFVIWQDGAEARFLEIHNLMANPAANPLNATFTGIVRDTNTVSIAGALVEVVDNSNWFALSNTAGSYAFSVSEGSYTLTCSSQGFFSSTTQGYQSIVSGQSKTINFTLGRMSSGTATGYAYLNDHIVISQVVGSTYNVTTSQCQEYVELYNPTTYYVQMVQGMAIDKISLKVQNDGDATPTTIDLDYTLIDSSIPPNGYFLIANYPTLYVRGINIAADAVMSASNPGYPNLIRTRGGPDLSCEPDIGDADAIGIAWTSTGQWIDQVGWQRNGLGHNPEFDEGTPLAQGQGLQDHELYVRYSAPTVLSPTLGRAYDSNDNSADFAIHADVDVTPYNRSAIIAAAAGTPATGALVFFNDPLSQTGTCVDVAFGTQHACRYTIPSIATGTWTMTVASGTYFAQTNNVTIAPGVSTGVPNSATSPTWPVAGQTTTLLRDTTNYAFISGVVTNVSGIPLSGILVAAAGNSNSTSTSGRYFLSVTTGDIQLIANYNNSNRAYTSQSVSLTSLTAGTLYDNPISPKTWFTLSLGGILKGFIRTSSSTPLPGRVAVALTGGSQAGQGTSGTDGYFYIPNLTTGTYTVQPALDPAESATPTSASVSLASTGTATSVSTFTITSGLAEIRGQATVSVSSTGITTGVLVYASTATLSGGATTPPPAQYGGTGMLCNPCVYSGSTDSQGYYSLDVRSSTTPYKLYGWYTSFSGVTPTVSRQGPYTVTVSSAGQIVSQNLAW